MYLRITTKTPGLPTTSTTMAASADCGFHRFKSARTIYRVLTTKVSFIIRIFGNIVATILKPLAGTTFVLEPALLLMDGNRHFLDLSLTISSPKHRMEISTKIQGTLWLPWFWASQTMRKLTMYSHCSTAAKSLGHIFRISGELPINSR